MEEQLFEQLTKIIDAHEEKLSYKRSGGLEERVSHVLDQYRDIARQSIFKLKEFNEDVKTQFKALEIVVEGLTSDGMNHGQKRVIANHIITMLRNMVDRLTQMEYDNNTVMFDRFNYFRSETPERRLYEERKDLKRRVEESEKRLESLKKVHPEIYKAITETDEIPF